MYKKMLICLLLAIVLLSACAPAVPASETDTPYGATDNASAPSATDSPSIPDIPAVSEPPVYVEPEFVPDYLPGEEITTNAFYGCNDDYKYVDEDRVFAEQGEWIYFIGRGQILYKAKTLALEADALDEDGLFRDQSAVVKVFGAHSDYEIEELYGSDSYSLSSGYKEPCIIGDWIYWVNVADIWRVRTDGREASMIVENVESFKHGRSYIVYDEKIYYTQTRETRLDASTSYYELCLMCCNLDGTNPEELFSKTSNDKYHKLFLLALTADERLHFALFNTYSDSYYILAGYNYRLNENDVELLMFAPDGGSGRGWNKREGRIVTVNNTMYLVGFDSKKDTVNYQEWSDSLGERDYLCSAESMNELIFDLSIVEAAGKENQNRFAAFPTSENETLIIGCSSDYGSNEVYYIMNGARHKINNDNDARNLFFSYSSGYVYYNIGRWELYRTKLDGTGWEDMSWLINNDLVAG